MIRPLTFCIALLLSPTAVQAAPLALDFLPPVMEPRDICKGPNPAPATNDLKVEGTDEELTDLDRITFLRRDIRNYMDEDADQFFDFIDALITRLGGIDPEYTPVDQTLERIELWLRAGRLDALAQSGLVSGLRDEVADMGNNQRVILARYYADGIGVPADKAFAQELIREAAYGGNANALLEIARLESAGELVEGWDAPLDLTVTMAFGGILGALDGGVCRRAERIAQAYLKGDVVQPNPALALAWFKFAADMGRAESAWRVVEFHLGADAAQKDNIELRRYLDQAVRRGISISDQDQTALVSSGVVDVDELAAMLGFNHSEDTRRTARSLAPLMQMIVNIDGVEADEEGKYLDYLTEISQMAEAPGRVFDRLAGEVLIKRGRWAGEAEALALLEEAVRRGDGPGTQRLANMLVRYRDDPAQIARVESLLMEVVARYGLAEAMDDLDALYRCQVNDAPRLRQADIWAANYRASGHASLTISATDLLALAPSRSPEEIAQIQSQALDRRSQMVASHAQRVQADPLVPDAARRYWAHAVDRSDQVLEAFAELEFELATTPAQRDLAIEFFRRVFLNNGVTTALDFAIALTEYNARDPEVAAEILRLLTMAGNRGEGAAIRLLSRLEASKRSEAEVYAEFADKIEARGDFLALMFAMPHIAPVKVDDYIDRAVSLMNCGTKDADELGDAYAIRAMGDMSYHWRRIGLHFAGGHVLAKLRLSDRQMQLYGAGTAPDAAGVAARALADGDDGALMRLVALTANADLSTYEPVAAAAHILNALQRSEGVVLAELVAIYRAAPAEVRDAIDVSTDIRAAVQRAAETGDTGASYQYAMLLRERARTPADLDASANWLERAATRGHRDAMFEYGSALGFGLGVTVDPGEALNWLEQARSVGHPRAAELAQMLRVKHGL